MVNKIVGFHIWKRPIIFMDVELLLDMAKFTNLTIIITNFVPTFIPNSRFKNVFPAYLGNEISPT
jgi:hypothetical protein